MERLPRTQSCSLCGTSHGLLAAEVEFWDLQQSNVVQCEECLHIQLDPKLTEESTQKGCFAYYKRESEGVPLHEQRRNQLRNFRRGVLFGMTLKQYQPHLNSVLEFGPGDGFFLQGLRFVFPQIRIAVLDIVEDVLAFCRETHGYETILGSPDSVTLPTKATFDLVIARDVIEHVNDVPKMFENLGQLLNVGGLFHFLTPNGYEDVWGHAMLWQNGKQTSELLINHVNYFEGGSLKNYLQKQGFEPLKYYTYKFKDFLKGKGRKKSLRWSRRAAGVKAQDYIQKPALPVATPPRIEDVYKEWYISKRFPWLTYAMSAYHHMDVLRVCPSKNKGHEIFGLFRRTI
jgi:SAM-dependent methyltransferase